MNVQGADNIARSRQGLTVVGLGESLFDVFDDRQVLGGAPLNAAVHAHQLLAQFGGRGVPATRAGEDDLGRRLFDELSSRGIATDWVQVDSQHATGRGLVTLQNGEPTFEIVADVAWDRLEYTESLDALARGCHAVCFGTLGQRNPTARETMQRFVARATQALCVFDVNLRQHYYSADVLRRSCELANVVKLNEHELPIVCQSLGVADARVESLLERFSLDAVVLTRGKQGTTVHTATGAFDAEPASYPRDPQADSVGAGDACAAGLIVGMLLSGSWTESVRLANHAGAFVASMPGATPTLPVEILEMARRLSVAKIS